MSHANTTLPAFFCCLLQDQRRESAPSCIFQFDFFFFLVRILFSLSTLPYLSLFLFSVPFGEPILWTRFTSRRFEVEIDFIERTSREGSPSPPSLLLPFYVSWSSSKELREHTHTHVQTDRKLLQTRMLLLQSTCRTTPPRLPPLFFSIGKAKSERPSPFLASLYNAQTHTHTYKSR